MSTSSNTTIDSAKVVLQGLARRTGRDYSGLVAAFDKAEMALQAGEALDVAARERIFRAAFKKIVRPQLGPYLEATAEAAENSSAGSSQSLMGSSSAPSPCPKPQSASLSPPSAPPTATTGLLSAPMALPTDVSGDVTPSMGMDDPVISSAPPVPAPPRNPIKILDSSSSPSQKAVKKNAIIVRFDGQRGSAKKERVKERKTEGVKEKKKAKK